MSSSSAALASSSAVKREHRLLTSAVTGRTLSAGCGKRGAVPAPDQLDEHPVGRLADQLDELVAHGLVHRSLSPRRPRGESVHHQWNSSPPSPQSRRFHSRTVDVTWPYSSVSSMRRSGSCQHTSGFQSIGRSSPARARPGAARSRGRPSKPGRLRKMHAPSTSRVTDSPSSLTLIGPPRRSDCFLNCHSSVRQLLRQPLGAPAIGVVGEVRAVRAAALHELGRWLRSARPGIRWPKMQVHGLREERDVEHPRALFVGIVEGDPLVQIVGRSSSPAAR